MRQNARLFPLVKNEGMRGQGVFSPQSAVRKRPPEQRDAIFKKMYEAIGFLNLHLTTKKLLLKLVSFFAQGDLVYPSQKYLAEELEVSVRTIERHIKILYEEGYVIRITRNGKKRRHYHETNLYEVNIDGLHLAAFGHSKPEENKANGGHGGGYGVGLYKDINNRVVVKTGVGERTRTRDPHSDIALQTEERVQVRQDDQPIKKTDLSPPIQQMSSQGKRGERGKIALEDARMPEEEQNLIKIDTENNPKTNDNDLNGFSNQTSQPRPKIKGFSEEDLETARKMARNLLDDVGNGVFLDKHAAFPERQPKMLLQALKSMGWTLENWKNYCQKAGQSDYLACRSKHQTKPSKGLSWFCDPQNIKAIIDGKYDDFSKKDQGFRQAANCYSSFHNIDYHENNDKSSKEEVDVFLITSNYKTQNPWLNEFSSKHEREKIKDKVYDSRKAIRVSFFKTVSEEDHSTLKEEYANNLMNEDSAVAKNFKERGWGGQFVDIGFSFFIEEKLCGPFEDEVKRRIDESKKKWALSASDETKISSITL